MYEWEHLSFAETKIALIPFLECPSGYTLLPRGEGS